MTETPSDSVRLVQLSLWSLALCLGVAGALLGHDQALDATRALASSDEIESAGLLGIAVAAAAMCAAVLWWTLRRMQTAVDTKPGRKVVLGVFSRIYPRVLAASPAFVVGLQYAWLVSEPWVSFQRAEIPSGAWLGRTVLCVGLFGLSVLAVRVPLAVWYKRQKRRTLSSVLLTTLIVMVVAPSIGGLPSVVAVLPGTAGGAITSSLTLGGHAVMAWSFVIGFIIFARRRRLMIVNDEVNQDNRLEVFLAQPPLKQGLIRVTSAALLVLLVAGGLFPRLGELAGPVGVLIIGLAIWVGIGNGVILVGSQRPLKLPFDIKLRGTPLWATVLIAAFFFNSCMIHDTNMVRLRTKQQRLKTAPKPLLESTPSDGPVLLVVAEGGGIYAAYHAAMVLGSIEEHFNDNGLGSFAERITVASGVSGGSVGLGVYAASVHAWRHNGFTTGLGLKDSMSDVLSGDLLSALLTAGITRNNLPIDPVMDRSRALEDALLRSWRRAVSPNHADALNAPITTLAENAGFDLMLNTTRVSTGSGYYVSSIELREPFCRHHRPIMLEDRARYIPSVAAMFLSARFPFVTSSGQLIIKNAAGVNNGEAERAFFVDGGYYENTGTAGALTIVRQLLNDQPDRSIKVIFIWAPEIKPKAAGGEWLRPINALMNTRSAHTRRMQSDLKELVGPDNTREAKLSLELGSGVRIPLGWVLSDLVRADITRQVVEANYGLEIQDLLGVPTQTEAPDLSP
ncbi:MAG: hypothetical protein AAGI53_13530 [Planctomycetota bacterium]